MLPIAKAVEEDARFWWEQLTPEERVAAVHDCLESALPARGKRGVPRPRRVFESLNAAGVRYLIGGAHALALYARPRATKEPTLTA